MTATPDPPGAALRRLRAPERGLTRAGIVAAAVGAVAAIAPYLGLAELARAVLAAPIDARAAVVAGIVVASGLVVAWCAHGLALWLTHQADARMQARLRRRMVEVLGRVPLGWYSDTTSGAVRKAAQDDVDDIHHLVAHHDVELTAAVVTPLAGLTYLALLDWRLALLAVATLPVYAVAYAVMMRGFATKMIQLDGAFARVGAAIVEFVHGIGVVKVFGGSRRAHRAYTAAVDEFAERYAGWVRPVLRLEALTSLALAAPVVALVAAGGGLWFVGAGWVGPVDALTAVLVAMIVPSMILTVNEGVTAQRRAVAAGHRIATLLATPPLPVADSPRVPDGHHLRFSDVRFSYDGTTPVLDGIDLDCPPGTVTALVGPSGAGKSTLASLVPRFADPVAVDGRAAGSVRLGGVDLREIDPAVLYRSVGFVLQDVALVRGTVADNIRLGDPTADDGRVVAAARAARIHERILALPRGYDTVVGDDAQFSGGEAQRVSIARALLADTPVLVLDEATAFADPESEAEIQDALSELARGRTVLVVAHRLTTITDADRIVVLDGGRVVGSGTHAELLAADGLYARLWAAHTGGPGDAAQRSSTVETGDAAREVLR